MSSDTLKKKKGATGSNPPEEDALIQVSSLFV